MANEIQTESCGFRKVNKKKLPKNLRTRGKAEDIMGYIPKVIFFLFHLFLTFMLLQPKKKSMIKQCQRMILAEPKFVELLKRKQVILSRKYRRTRKRFY